MSSSVKPDVMAQHFLECEYCETRSAQHFCNTCRGALCDVCKEKHKRKKISQDHEIIPLVSSRKQTSSFCSDHRTERCKFYCKPCKKAVCSECFTEKHKGHTIEKLSSFIEEQRNNLWQCINRIGKFLIPAYEKHLTEAKTSHAGVIKSADETCSLVQKQTENIISAVKSTESDILTALQKNRSQTLSFIQSEQSVINERINQLHEIKKSLQMMYDSNAVDDPFLKQQMSRMEEMAILTEKTAVTLSKFVPGELDMSILQKQIGNLTLFSVSKTQVTLIPAVTSTSRTQTPVDIKSTLPVQHAEMVFEETMRQLSCVIELETFTNKGPEVALRVAIQTELNTMEQIVKTLPQKMPREDPRLKFPIVYFKSCSVPSRIIDRILHEQFSYCPLMDGDDRAKEIKKVAIRKLEQQLNTKDGDQLEKHTLMWHQRYHQFRKITFFFVRGLQNFNEERYDQALLYLVHSYSLNTTINDKATELRGLQGNLINFYRRQCVLHLNDIATNQFENQDDISESLKLMNDLVVPCLPLLLSSPYKDDVSAGEEMREKWCSFLGQEICDKKIEKLQDLMSKLFDPPAESKNAQIPGVTPNNLKDLYKDYVAVMDIAHQSGYIELAAKSTLQ